MEANIARASFTKFGYKHAYGWRVINHNRVLQVIFHIWPLTYIHDLWPQNIVKANIGHLPTNFGYKQAYGWKVINRNRVLQINIHIWPRLTFDLLTCLWPKNIVEANKGHLPTKYGYKQAYGWKVINPNRVLQVNFHIWPLTYLCDLWPHHIMEVLKE